MLASVAADFAGLSGVEVHTLLNSRWPEFAPADCIVHEVRTTADELIALGKQASAADWTLLIAPELDDLLLSRCRLAERTGGRLLGPGSALVQLASDKHATAEYLRQGGIAVPAGRAIAADEKLPVDFDYPAVLKPRYGAGSIDICMIDSPEAADVAECGAGRRIRGPSRLETYVSGLAVSVAILCGPAGRVALPPCGQRLSVDGRFTYVGGSLPLDEPLAHRATKLASRAVAALVRPYGYIGVDMILGHAMDGSRDVVVEINPRVTTSYVGLRAACRQNLAGAMLDMAEGRNPQLAFDPAPLAFDTAGRVRTHSLSMAAGELPCG